MRGDGNQEEERTVEKIIPLGIYILQSSVYNETIKESSGGRHDLFSQ